MAPSVSKEHLIRGSDPSLWGLSGLECEEEEPRLSQRIWTLLNSKLFNAVIVILVICESLVIIGHLLIAFDLIHDPSWKKPNASNINTTNLTSSLLTSSSSQLSPKLLTVKFAFKYISFVILSLFLVETLLRVYSGKLKLLVQPFEILDALLVVIVFTLNLVFHIYNHSDDNDKEGREAVLLIILLRLWRIHQIIDILVDESQQKLLQILNICEKDKSNAEHKIDIMILKVEDLEHEVAYLKEKLKKAERENSAALEHFKFHGKNKSTAKRSESSFSTSSAKSFCPCKKNNNLQSKYNQFVKSYTSVTVEPSNYQSSESIFDATNSCVGQQHDLDTFANELAQSITIDVMSAVMSNNGNHNANNTFHKIIRPLNQHKMESDTKNRFQNDNDKSSSSMNPFTKKYNGSSNDIIISETFLFSDPNSYTQSSIPMNVNSSDAVNQLNDDEADRCKKLEINSNDKDIPLNLL